MLALFLALALGLVSLALIARLPQQDAPRGVRWLPVTLLLYNLWVVGFLAAGYFNDHVVPQAPPALTPPLADTWRLALVALSLAWLYAHVAQVQAFLGIAPAPLVRRRVRVTFAVPGVALLGSWFFSMWTGERVLFHVLGSFIAVAVFPAALVASVFLFVRSRRLEDVAWRTRLSVLALSYVALFTCLFALWIFWGRLGAVSRELPVALDAILELLYNVVAIVWVARLTTWLKGIPMVQAARVLVPAMDRARLLAEYGITRREAEVIELICLGKTNQEIADQLFISLTTVKDHNYVTFQKLGVRNRTELTRLVLGASHAQPK